MMWTSNPVLFLAWVIVVAGVLAAGFLLGWAVFAGFAAGLVYQWIMDRFEQNGWG